MLIFETKFPIRYYETDQMGIVHHSNYIRYFECARNVMMDELGYPIQKCEEDGVTIPVVKLECHYRYPARMGDVVKAVAMIRKTPMAKLEVEQAVYNQDGKVCADGIVTLGFLSKDTGRPVRCPEIMRTIIENAINSDGNA